MVGIPVLNPFLFVFTKVMPRIIGPYYRAFGVTGVLALPFITLTLEKVGYDTFLAARGRDLDAEREAAAEASGSKKIGAHGEFPSGGAALPSFSLIPVASEQSRLVITLLGDKPRREATIS